MAHDIGIAATRLSCPTFTISGVTGALATSSPHTVKLGAGVYTIRTQDSSEPSWHFDVTAEGLIDYDIGLDTSVGGFLTGRGTATIDVLGFLVTLDGRDLSAPHYLVANVTSWLSRTELNALHLLAGQYRFVQPNAVAVDFVIRIDGTLDYANGSDVFLRGRGTSVLRILGFSIAIDARVLTAAHFSLASMTSWITSTEIQTLRLLPGPYHFLQPNELVPQIAFEVVSDGTVDYASSNSGFLVGQGTNSLGIMGSEITLDASNLTTPHLLVLGTTAWIQTAHIHTLNLLPGRYQLMQPSGLVPEAAFEVRADGTIDYPSSGNSLLEGRGSMALRVNGFEIVLDARGFSPSQFMLANTSSWFSSEDVQVMRLLPGHYHFLLPGGPLPEADFDVPLDGTVHYEPAQDVTASPPGVLSGLGTHEIRFVGFHIFVDAGAYAGEPVQLMPSGVAIDSATSGPMPVSVLPRAGLRLEIGGTDPKVVLFDFVVGGRVILDEPYPFVDLGWQRGQPLIRLSRNEFRYKRLCCITLTQDNED